MSIKIYDAYILRKATYKDAFNLLLPKRKEFTEVGNKKLNEYIAKEVVWEIVMSKFEKKHREIDEFISLKLRDYKRSHHVFWDYKGQERIEVSAFLAHSGRNIIILLDTMQREYQDILASIPELEEYGYWNNTDRPDDATARAWSKRKRDYAEIFKRSCFEFSKAGLTMPLYELQYKHTPYKDELARIIRENNVGTLQTLSKGSAMEGYSKRNNLEPTNDTVEWSGRYSDFLELKSIQGSQEEKDYINTYKELEEKLEEWVKKELENE
jgi:hypothetical protein